MITKQFYEPDDGPLTEEQLNAIRSMSGVDMDKEKDYTSLIDLGNDKNV